MPNVGGAIEVAAVLAHPDRGMNKGQLAKSVNHVVRLQPAAHGPLGETLDHDWLISNVNDEAVTLQHVPTGQLAHVGLAFCAGAFGRASVPLGVPFRAP